MKMKCNAVFMLVLASLLFSCKKDNYEEPTSALTGRIVYNGEPILVEYDRVPFRLFEFGFGKVGSIDGTITPEGAFSHMLFDGQYKLVISPGQGPFRWPETGGKADSVTINVSGNTNLDVEVRPYYMIRNANITGNGTTVTGTFALEKIITDVDAKDIEFAALFLNKTQFVGEANEHRIARTDLAGSAIANMGSISISTAVPAMSPTSLTQNYIFARIGVKIAGVEDLIFSPVQKITF
jgi:hypothetical protein